MLVTVLSMAELSLLEIEQERIIGAFATFFLLMKLYDWLRLFESTGFYVQLVGATIYDVRWFAVLLFIALIMFGLPMNILSLNRPKDASLIGEDFGFWPVDMIYNQYLLSLGEFATKDSYVGNPQGELILCIFLVATLFTQITMLNMLIAIMGDSFANFMENREVNSIRTKLGILGEQAPILSN
mmetsp:Transcript_30121/g.39989  ORF Transcript_30121/g.39989 Transcript_30121/m.39989 type:complete len:184 (-) Transcript_30121:387-938(-)